MKHLTFEIIILLTICILLSGCGRPDTDVTSSKEYGFAPFAGTVWKTKTKTALAEGGRGMPKSDFHLVAPQNFDPAHPKYLPGDLKQMVAELPAGTRLRITRLMKNHGNWGGVWVEGVLEDAAHFQKPVAVSNRLLAKNRFIWGGWSDSKDWGVDPDMLEKGD